jgi:small subunit ribosomal protein S1
VIAVAMRDDHGVEVADDLLCRERKRHGRVRDLRDGALDRRPRPGVVQHRIDENSLSGQGENDRRAANERQVHGPVSTSCGPIDARSGIALHPAILRDPMANDIAEKPAAAEEGVWTTGPDGELVPDYDAAFPEINEGEVVHGTVVRVDKDEVLVDIGYKSEGVIPVAELTIRRSVNPADEVSVGEEIDALVLTKEDAEGRLILSKKRARFELAWKRIEAAAESGEPVTGKVIEVVKGGLILDLGVRGFLPASLVDIRRVQDLDEFLGKELRCKVIELNRSRNNVVLSRRAVLEDERKEMRQAILDRLSPGDVIEGQISNIVDFGAFVDLDGMDGLIHISELSWSHVNHPSEVLDIGQTVKVKVLDIDRDRQRISLGLKQTQTDPWQQVLDSYREDDVVEGRVAKVVTFGAFVEILPGVEGLVHISELAPHHVENPREVVSQGDAVNVRILEIDGERRRLSLSLKRVEEGDVPVPRADGAESVHTTPDLKLSEEAFPTASAVEVTDDTEIAEADVEPVAEVELEPEADVEPVAEAELEPEAEAEETGVADEADSEQSDSG